MKSWETEPDSSLAAMIEQLRRAPPEPPATVSTPPVSPTRTSPTPASATRAAGQEPPVGSGPDQPALAVLPFANMSGERDDEHFSDGLTDELISAIAKIGGIRVTGRTSSFAFKGKPIDLQSIADSLRVTTVLEGSVRRSGERLEIGVQLVRTSDGSVMWSEMYNRGSRDVFDVQAQIARAVAAALHVTLDPTAALGVQPATTDPVAHDLYLRGKYFHNRASPDDIRRAVSHFERAIERDPDFARAYAGLADAHLLLAIIDGRSPRTHISRAHAAVARALAIDGSLAEAHASLASILFAFNWDWVAAGHAFERAIALDPGYGSSQQRYGLYLMYRGSLAAAQRVLEDARAADPLAPSALMNLVRLHLTAHREELAVPLLHTAAEMNPRLALAHEQLGHAYVLLGQPREARACFRSAAALSGERGDALLAYGLATSGDRSLAKDILQPGAAVGESVAWSGVRYRDGPRRAR